MPTVTLAFRNIFRHKFRTGMTLAAVAFGVAALVVSGGFVKDVYIQLAEALIHSQTGHVQLARTGYFSYGSRSPEKFALDGPERLRTMLASNLKIKDVLARVQF